MELGISQDDVEGMAIAQLQKLGLKIQVELVQYLTDLDFTALLSLISLDNIQ